MALLEACLGLALPTVPAACLASMLQAIRRLAGAVVVEVVLVVVLACALQVVVVLPVAVVAVVVVVACNRRSSWQHSWSSRQVKRA
jgi:hypothetical protein